jgi:ADP-heptose:LPS heptosyltransferase
MGHGDDLLAVGESWRLHQTTGKRVVIGRSLDEPRNSPMHENVPWLAGPGEKDAVLLRSYPGNRPHLDYTAKGFDRIVEGWSPPTPRLFFTEEERLAAECAYQGLGEPDVALEPHVKGSHSGENKAWPWERWNDLSLALDELGCRALQLSDPKQKRSLAGCRRAYLPLRVALATLQLIPILVTTDGLLHHAAAAVGTPAVVLWGGRMDPERLGYPWHTNIYRPGPGSPCGSRKERCLHCKACMESITVEEVVEACLRKKSGVSSA